MPASESGETDVYFVPKLSFAQSVSEAKAFLAPYDLVYSPRAHAAAIEADPALADDRMNGTLWGDDCFLVFSRRDRYCGHILNGNYIHWRYFVGVPASHK